MYQKPKTVNIGLKDDQVLLLKEIVPFFSVYSIYLFLPQNSSVYHIFLNIALIHCIFLYYDNLAKYF